MPKRTPTERSPGRSANRPGSSTVTVSAKYDEGSSGCNDVGRLTTISVELDAVLGDRTIEVRTLGRGVECNIAGDDVPRCVELT